MEGKAVLAPALCHTFVVRPFNEAGYDWERNLNH